MSFYFVILFVIYIIDCMIFVFKFVEGIVHIEARSQRLYSQVVTFVLLQNFMLLVLTTVFYFGWVYARFGIIKVIGCNYATC